MKYGASNVPVSSKNYRQGLTLVEVLIVILVSSIIMGSVVGLLFMFVFNSEEDIEYSTARQRGQMAFALLSKPVKQSSLGIPNTSDDFKTCFSENATVNSWDGPVHIESGGRVLNVAYAVPSGIAVEHETDFTQGSSITINLTSTDVESNDWVTFPSASSAFLVTDTGLSSIQVTPKATGTLPFFDELHYIHFLTARLSNGQLVVKDSLSTESLGIVEGIADIFFSYDPGEQIVTTSVLARGDRRHDDLVSPADIKDWPDNPVSNETRHYRVSVHTSSWRVRN